MNQQLREAKQAIRSFIRAHWTDQKLAEVLAFAQDGKMSFLDSCGCLMGVTVATRLHAKDHRCSLAHTYAARSLKGAQLAEDGFNALGSYNMGLIHDTELRNECRIRTSIAIFKAEIRRRDRMRAPAAQLLGEAVNA